MHAQAAAIKLAEDVSVSAMARWGRMRGAYTLELLLSSVAKGGGEWPSTAAAAAAAALCARLEPCHGLRGVPRLRSRAHAPAR